MNGFHADEASELYGRLLEADDRTKKAQRDAAGDSEDAHGPRDDVDVTVSLTAAKHDRIALDCDADESVEEWVREAVEQRLMDREHELLNAVTADIGVDVPPEIAERARLRYEHAMAHGGDQDIDDFLLDYVSFDMTWLLEERPITNTPEESDEATGDADEE